MLIQNEKDNKKKLEKEIECLKNSNEELIRNQRNHDFEMKMLNYKIESCDQFKKMKIEEFHRDYNLQISENQKLKAEINNLNCEKIKSNNNH